MHGCFMSVAFREQLQNPLVSFNITETIVNLEMVRDNSALNVLPALMTLIDDVITNLTNVRDVQIPQLMSLTVSKGMHINDIQFINFLNQEHEDLREEYIGANKVIEWGHLFCKRM